MKKHVTNASHDTCKELWQSIFGDTYQDKHDFNLLHEGRELKLSGGGGDSATYDLTLAEDVTLSSLGDAIANKQDSHFALSYSKESFKVPSDILLLVCSKSTIARCKINASFTTVIDNGFIGQSLTIEIVNLSVTDAVTLPKGTPIAQIVPVPVYAKCETYAGKYQNQPNNAVSAR